MRKDYRSQEGIDNTFGRKRLEAICRYARDMYINGFRDRSDYAEFSGKEPRSIDSYRAIIDSWLGEYHKFDKINGGMYSICIDGRKEDHNPLYSMWKAKNFTDKDLYLHMSIMTLSKYFEEGVSVSEFIELMETEIKDKIENLELRDSLDMDRKTVANKLNEYCELGILYINQEYNVPKYRIDTDASINADMLHFASEVMPCGVIGSFLIDREKLLQENFIEDTYISFKHHVISQAFDSEVMQMMLDAIENRLIVYVDIYDKKRNDYSKRELVPIKIIRNVQTGRQYLAYYLKNKKEYDIIRLDYIRIDSKKFEVGTVENHEAICEKFSQLEKNIWAASSFKINSGKTEHVKFSIKVDDNEQYIVRRLYRECRNGIVTKVSDNIYNFDIDLYDSQEIVPWMNSFIGRLIKVEFENKRVEETYFKNIRKMFEKQLSE